MPISAAARTVAAASRALRGCVAASRSSTKAPAEANARAALSDFGGSRLAARRVIPVYRSGSSSGDVSKQATASRCRVYRLAFS
jgi:hypothetical protein